VSERQLTILAILGTALLAMPASAQPAGEAPKAGDPAVERPREWA